MKTHIPFEGGSGVVPTGAVQFKNDWPGLFIRGDTAIGYLGLFRAMIEQLKDTTDLKISAGLMVVQELADIIERDVIVRK
jgi:hypothetical protein